MTKRAIPPTGVAIIASLLSCCCAEVASADASRVLLFQAGPPDKVVSAALPRIAAELRVEGITADLRGVVSVDPSPAGALGREPTTEMIMAAAAASSAAGALLLWAQPGRRVRQVQVSTFDARRRTWLHQILFVDGESDAPAVLAIRAVEALRAHFLRRRYEPIVTKQPRPVAAAAPTTRPMHPKARLGFGVGGSVRGEADAAVATIAPLVHAGVEAERWWARLTLAPLSSDASVVDPRARVAVNERTAYAEVARLLLSPQRALRPYLGAKLGAVMVATSAVTNDPTLVTSGESFITAIGGVGGGLQLALSSGWHITCDLAVLAFASQAVVTVDGVQRQRLGRPRLQMSLALTFLP